MMMIRRIFAVIIEVEVERGVAFAIAISLFTNSPYYRCLC